MARNRDVWKAPLGMYRVLLVDEEQNKYWPQQDYERKGDATHDADSKNRDRTGPFGTYYTVVDDQGVEDPNFYVPPRLRKSA